MFVSIGDILDDDAIRLELEQVGGRHASSPVGEREHDDFGFHGGDNRLQLVDCAQNQIGRALRLERWTLFDDAEDRKTALRIAFDLVHELPGHQTMADQQQALLDPRARSHLSLDWAQHHQQRRECQKSQGNGISELRK